MGTILYKPPLKNAADILITAHQGAITQLYFKGGRTTPPTLSPTPSALSEDSLKEDRSLLAHAIKELDMYFTGQLKNFTLPLAAAGTPFRLKVWEALRQIPYGHTITYKQLAQYIQQPTAIRAVGGANHHNPISIIIPCHRVIGASGKLVGYGGGIDMKAALLDLEMQF